MMVPRSFKYASSPPKESSPEKNPPSASHTRPSSASSNDTQALRDQSPPLQTGAQPIAVPTRPVAVPAPPSAPARTRPGHLRAPSAPQRRMGGATRRQPSAHDPNALPPAVAALLAVTTIPARRPNRARRRSSALKSVSIDELVNEWKSDELTNASLSSSPALSLLLEDTPDDEEQTVAETESMSELPFLQTRSLSADSIPSLEADDKSLFSFAGPSTPGSLRSKRSVGNMKRDRVSRSLPTSEDCDNDHPLIPSRPHEDDPDEALLVSPINPMFSKRKARFGFKSNLTASLNALKNAAISSIASMAPATSAAPVQRSAASRFSDDLLWSHPFLFPRLSSERRPNIVGTPSQAQRHYFNPPPIAPLNFEEQEGPYQQALHRPYLLEAQQEEDPPPALNIQMQTYTRAGRRRSPGAGRHRTSSEHSNASEAGRASLTATGVRQREPRENSDFLRVVVLEMNMRREGKLEVGRAKIWLPPRQVVSGSNCVDGRGDEKCERGVPRRWSGVSA